VPANLKLILTLTIGPDCGNVYVTNEEFSEAYTLQPTAELLETDA